MSAFAVRLSDQERGVLSLLAQGLGLKRVARRLGLSSHTALTYKSRAFRKLGAVTLPEAMLRAHAAGQIDLAALAATMEASRG